MTLVQSLSQLTHFVHVPELRQSLHNIFDTFGDEPQVLKCFSACTAKLQFQRKLAIARSWTIIPVSIRASKLFFGQNSVEDLSLS
jgi:hypothetical protein